MSEPPDPAAAAAPVTPPAPDDPEMEIYRVLEHGDGRIFKGEYDPLTNSFVTYRTGELVVAEREAAERLLRLGLVAVNE
jgi:hypothetical protein